MDRSSGQDYILDMKKLSSFHLLLILVLSFSQSLWAWGRRGHSLIGHVAANVVAVEPNAEFMKGHSYDFGYLNNVPDFIWKRPATFEVERNQHYVNFEVFEAAFAKRPEVKEPLTLTRKEFDSIFPDVKVESGRAFWRIRELYEQMEVAAKALREFKEEKGKERQKLQEKWIIPAGVMGHYVADLGMPLHVTSNHDGQETNQRGIHSYFEEKVVDELYPDLEPEVMKKVKAQWPAFKKANEKKSVLELVNQLASNSRKNINKMLTLDRKSGRKNIKKDAKMFRPMIVDRMTEASLTLAELWRRQLGWTFDDNRFYFFGSEPEYIKPE